MSIRKKIEESRNLMGFTLIELLVVIAIIAILAILLSPLLKSVQRNAKSVKCMSNLRSLGQAGQLYAGEHDGQIVALYSPVTEIWTMELAPYLGLTPSNVVTQLAGPQNRVFVCPEAPTRFGYGHNYQYLGWGTTPANTYFVKPAQIANPSKTVFLVDSIDTRKSPPMWSPAVRNPSYGGGGDLIVEFRHPGNLANVLWVDGHVSSEAKSPLMDNDTLWDRN